MTEFQDRLQQNLGAQYRLERELGGGGMSRVFLAEETALARKVVIKVLPPEMFAGVNQERFRREIQLAARLQHPHIVPLLAAGSAGDVLWYAMPFIEGESLRVKLARGGELPVAETARILREVADALAYAHSQGVVHRDIKPDNVMLSGRHALVTDFGVAKAVSESTGDHTLTSLGLALGTPAYMAPEQASADPHVDHRADVYALGAMAYEMLAGHPPFSGMSAQSILAAHITQTPATISSHRPAVPAALNAIVMRCLEKRPADRWQSAEELIPHLDALLTPSGGMAPTGAVPAAHQTISSGTEAALRKGHPVRVAVLFAIASAAVLALANLVVNRMGLPGWVIYAAVGLLLLGFPIMLATSISERRRLLARTTGSAIPTVETGLGAMLTWKKALTGGGLAFAGLAGGAALFMALRIAGVGPFATLLSAGVIKERDPLVVADFENRTTDSTLAQSVTEALRIDLARSPKVRLLETSDVAATLSRMERDPTTALTAQVAREVAERAGAAAVVTGEIAPLGAGYVLSVRLISTKDGATLLAERETADGAGGLIAAVDALSKKVREGIGESLRSIRAGAPLEDVTTRSLEALRKYSQANAASDAGEQVKARDILKEAIHLDTTFAMAYRKLAALIGNLGGNFSEQAAAAGRAFELRERLPEREKLLATAYYYWTVDYNSDKIIAAYQQVLDTWPDDKTAGNNIAIELNTRRRYAEAEAILDRQIASSPQVGVLWANLNESLSFQGKFAKADSVMARWAAAQPGSRARMSQSFRYHYTRGDYPRALAYADSVGQQSDPNWQARSRHQRGTVFRIQGQLARADQEERAESEINTRSGALTQAFNPVVEIANSQVLLHNRTEAALRIVDSALAKLPMDSIDPVDRPYLVLADFYVRAGEVEKAERLVAEYERSVPEPLKKADFARIQSHAMVAFGKGQYAEAIKGFREFRDKNGGEIYLLNDIALAFDRMGQSDSAVASYEAYTAAGDAGPSSRQYYLPLVYRRLGELYEGKDNQKALDNYGRFVALWKDADSDLQPKVQEVKKRMAALAGEPEEALMDDLQQRLTAALGAQYRIERELGGGGMSQVFLAEETALGRKVVIKVLPPNLAAVLSPDRFQREVRLAAALQHPHIVPLLAAGKAGDVLYYTMPFIDGESLRARLGREGPLPIAETTRLLRETADALAYAHRQGIIHRDIKPDNVLLSAGHAVITDFGIAKALSEAGGSGALTATGVSVGTAAYMSPEQAAGEANVDQRADIYALGAMAYEMLTGEAPFRGSTAQAIIAAHMTRVPAPVTDIRPGVPAALVALVARCLEKLPSDRFQGALELIAALDAGGTTTPATGTMTAGIPATARSWPLPQVLGYFAVTGAAVLGLAWALRTLAGLPDWFFPAAVILLALGLPVVVAATFAHNRRLIGAATPPAMLPAAINKNLTLRKAVTGGIAAFSALGVVTAGYMAMRTLGIGPVGTLVASGKLGERERLIIAEFDDQTREAVLGAAVTQAFRVDFSQSKLVSPVEADYVRRVLRLMRRPDSVAVTLEVAREIAQREGFKAVVAGELQQVGPSILVSAQLVNAASGEVLATARETARDSTGVLDAVDRVSKQLRERIGESLRSIRGNAPLAQVTTGSLEALRNYSRALQAGSEGDHPGAVARLEEAVAADSGFAMAWRRLGTVLNNAGENPSRASDAILRAYALRDRLTFRERKLTEYTYYADARSRMDSAAMALQSLLAEYPNDSWAHNNLGVAHELAGNDAEAGRSYQRAAELEPENILAWGNILTLRIGAGEYDSAAATLRVIQGRFPAGPGLDYRVALLDLGRRNFAAAEDSLRAMAARHQASAGWRDAFLNNLAGVLALRGKVSESNRMLEGLAAARKARGETATALEAEVGRVIPLALYREDLPAARAALAAILKANPLERMPERDRPLYAFTRAAMSVGDRETAARLMEEFNRNRGNIPGRVWPLVRQMVGGEVLAMRPETFPQAQAEFRNVAAACSFCIDPPLALAFERVGEPDSALKYFQRWADVGENWWEGGNYLHWAPIVYHKLGELYQAKGERAKAVDFYGRFTELWREADPEFQPKVKEARRRIAELVAEPKRP